MALSLPCTPGQNVIVFQIFFVRRILVLYIQDSAIAGRHEINTTMTNGEMWASLKRLGMDERGSQRPCVTDRQGGQREIISPVPPNKATGRFIRLEHLSLTVTPGEPVFLTLLVLELARPVLLRWAAWQTE